MSYPKTYPGLPNKTVYTGQTVEAAHIQSICDWLRWYIVYFNPSHHTIFTWGGQNADNISSSNGQSFTATYSFRNDFENNFFLFGCFPDYIEKACVSFCNNYGNTLYNQVVTRNNPNLLISPSSWTSVYLWFGEGTEGFFDLWQTAYIPPEES